MKPVVTDRNKSHYQSWNCSTNGTTVLVERSPNQSCDLYAHDHVIIGATLHNRSYGHVRHVCDLLTFVIAGPVFSTWPSTLLPPDLFVRPPTTSGINRSICRRFICESSYFVIVVGCDMVAISALDIFFVNSSQNRTAGLLVCSYQADTFHFSCTKLKLLQFSNQMDNFLFPKNYWIWLPVVLSCKEHNLLWVYVICRQVRLIYLVLFTNFITVQKIGERNMVSFRLLDKNFLS